MTAQHAAIAMVMLSALLGLGFVGALGIAAWRRRGHVGEMLWLQVALGLAPVGFDLLLLLGAFGVQVTAWSVLLVLLLQDVVFAWRLWFLLASRRRPVESDAMLLGESEDGGTE